MAEQLEGGRVVKGRWNPGGRSLELVVAPAVEDGPDLLLRYRGVQLLEPALPQLAALIEDTSLTIVRARLSPRAHDLSFSSGAVLHVAFGAVEITATVHQTPGYTDPEPRFLVLSC